MATPGKVVLKILNASGKTPGYVLKVQSDGTVDAEAESGGGGDFSGTSTEHIPFTDNIPLVTPPTQSSVGNDIETRLYPDGVTTGERIAFTVPEDYDSGNIEVVLCYKPDVGTGGVVRLSIDGEIADLSAGAVDAVAPENSDITVAANTNVVAMVVKTLLDANIDAGDTVALDVQRLGGDAADTLAGGLHRLYFAFRYTSKANVTTLTYACRLFDTTDEGSPADGSLGASGIETKDYADAASSELKCVYVVPDVFDGDDLYISLDWGTDTQQADNEFVIETEGEVANPTTGAINTFGVDQDVISVPNEQDVLRRSFVRAIPGTNLVAGAMVVLKIARRGADASDTHTGKFQLAAAIFTLGVVTGGGTSPSVTEHYMEFAGLNEVTGGVNAERDYPSFSGDFEAVWALVSTGASKQADTAFAGRLQPSSVRVAWVKVPIKGTSGAHYRLRVYAEGSGATPVYDSGLTAAPTSMTELSVAYTSMSAQPTGKKRFFVVVEAYLDDTEALYVGRPWFDQE